MVEGRKLEGEDGVTINKEWTKKQIDEELRDHGIKVEKPEFGYETHAWLGLQMEISPNIARVKFVVTERISDPNGQLIRGVGAFIAESIASAAGHVASKSGRIAGVVLNVNNLHPAHVGQEVTVIAKPLKKDSNIQTWEIKFETEILKGQSSTIESLGEHPRETVLVATARLTLVELTNSAELTTKTQKVMLERRNLPSKL